MKRGRLLVLTRAPGKAGGGLRGCLRPAGLFLATFALFFSPALISGSVIGRHDGIFFHLPYFYAKKTFWDPLLQAGFPMTADPQVMAWYPPSLGLSLVPGAWNLFVVSAYVLAACFAYGYTYAVTRSKLAGTVGGFTYAMSGFMLAQVDHTSIIHVAAWLPLVLWSLEMLARSPASMWLAVGSMALACASLAGHMQIFVVSCAFGAMYALFVGCSLRTARGRYLLRAALMFVLGFGLAGLQIVPALQLAGLSSRAQLDYAGFISFSLPPSQLVTMFFPALYGGLSRYGSPIYFGAWNFIEMTGYVGLLPLMLAAVGVVAWRRRPLAAFWLCAATLTLILALGGATPLARLTYHVPVLNLFRAQARYLFLTAFSVSVLAGLGVTAILNGTASRRLILATVGGFFAILVACLLGLRWADFTGYMAWRGVAPLSLRPWSNPAIGVPTLVFVLTASVFVLWHRVPRSSAAQVAVLFALVVDLGSFGWFLALDNMRTAEVLRAPPVVLRYGAALAVTNQRMAAVDGLLAPLDEAPPNISRLWRIPNAAIYGPLILRRFEEVLPLGESREFDPRWQERRADQILNLLAVRYLFLQRANLRTPIEDVGTALRLRHVEEVGGVSIYENQTAMPRAWLVPTVTRMTAEEAVSAVRSSRLPDGTFFDPYRTALVEDPVTLAGDARADVRSTVAVLRVSNDAVDLRTVTGATSFLVVSDTYYPGWEARIDGATVRVYRADAVLRGVIVPAGRHDVQFEFVPHSFYQGLATTCAALLALFVVCLTPILFNQRRDPRAGSFDVA